MRQSAQQADNTPTWKQEVNRRVAEHNGRKVQPAARRDAAAEGPAAGSVAAKAAARVAARYAKAPSYSEMLADEARAAVRAAEAASMAALQAQAAAESVLAGLEAASSAAQTDQPAEGAQTWDQEFFTPAVPEPVQPALVQPVAHPGSKPSARPTGQPSARDSFEIRWEADMPVRESAPAAARPSRGSQGTGIREGSIGNAWQTERDLRGPLETEGFELVEPAQPIHANLIEFPRELVATRKIRPRRAEGPYAESVAALGQLSIFEVDPDTVSFEPSQAGAAAEAETGAWVGPEWSGIELDEEPLEEIASPGPCAAATGKAEPAPIALPVRAAALNRRMLAALVDFSLVTGAFVGAAMMASLNGMIVHSLTLAEVGAAVAIPLFGAFYLVLFFTLSQGTPGMRYANVEIRTFGGERPVRAQRLRRLAALAISVAPIGMGAAWAIFDRQRLCWHDRLSGTYLRKG